MRRILGIKINAWGGAVFKTSDFAAKDDGDTAWTIDESNSEKYVPSQATFVVNYRVDDLLGLVENLKKADVVILKEPETSEYGKFASIMDPDGNRLELWEP